MELLAAEPGLHKKFGTILVRLQAIKNALDVESEAIKF